MKISIIKGRVGSNDKILVLGKVSGTLLLIVILSA
jgi:hypothetical protein